MKQKLGMLQRRNTVISNKITARCIPGRYIIRVKCIGISVTTK